MLLYIVLFTFSRVSAGDSSEFTFRVEWIDGVGDMPPKTFMSFYLDEFGNVTELKTTYYEPVYFKKVSEEK